MFTYQKKTFILVKDKLEFRILLDSIFDNFHCNQKILSIILCIGDLFIIKRYSHIRKCDTTNIMHKYLPQKCIKSIKISTKKSTFHIYRNDIDDQNSAIIDFEVDESDIDILERIEQIISILKFTRSYFIELIFLDIDVDKVFSEIQMNRMFYMNGSYYGDYIYNNNNITITYNFDTIILKNAKEYVTNKQN